MAAILVFGSANTGEWKEGVSDIDLIILLKSGGDFKHEMEEITAGFKELKISIVHLRDISNYEKHIYKNRGWSSWITVINGSKKIYSTNEFRRFRKRLINNPIPESALFKYLEHKDEFELEGYLKKYKGRIKAKGIFSHLRRKLQIINYFENKKIVFDYLKCLKKIKIDKGKKKNLKELYLIYKKKQPISDRRIKEYENIALSLTNRIKEMK